MKSKMTAKEESSGLLPVLALLAGADGCVEGNPEIHLHMINGLVRLL